MVIQVVGWRFCDDPQHLSRSVAPDFSCSSRRAVVGAVLPVVVVVVGIAATTTWTEQHLSQILLDDVRSVGFWLMAAA